MSVYLEHLEETVDEFLGRLGRHIEHDVRSLEYAVENQLGSLLPAEKYGAVEHKRWSPILDQGSLGSCTGNAMAGWLGCEPYCLEPVPEGAPDYDEALAVKLYEVATRLDSFPGQYPPEDTGSSGLAVAKAARQLGFIGSYGHATSVAGLLHALQTAPVIVGVPWYSGFDTPDAHGMVHVSGAVRGGHEFLIRGYTPGATLNDGVLLADNSWSSSWGDNGSFRFTLGDWQTLRVQHADVTIPRL